MIRYRPEIDGLRAIAVLIVILYHAGVQPFGGGFVGVDVFFVISGYLITSIIRADLVSGTFSFARFYERRARRILPVLLFVLFATMPFAWFWLLPEQYSQYGGSLVSTSLYYSNFFFWGLSGYFDTSSELRPLLHTWSLSVEEQYYIIFPALLLLLWTRWRKRVPLLIGVGVLLSFAVAEYGARRGASGAYFLLPTRAWELGIGALLALQPAVGSALSARMGRALGASGLLLILASAALYNRGTPFPGFYALAPTLGTALVIAVVRTDEPLGRLLGSRPLVAVGLASYSLYLWHQPVLAFARQRLFGQPSGPVLGLLLVGVGALSWLSWRFIERPFRDRNRISTRRLVVSCVLATLAIVTVGGGIVAKQGVPGRFSFIGEKSERMEIPRHDNGWCFYSIDTDDRLSVGAQGQACLLGDRSKVPVVLLFGDSFAGQYEPVWDAIGKSHGFAISAVSTNWCYPALDDSFIGPKASRAYAQCLANREFLRRNATKYDAVILGGAWLETYNLGRPSETIRLIKWLTSLGKNVLVMPSPPAYDSNVNYSYLLASKLGETLDLSRIESKEAVLVARAEGDLRASIASIPGAVFIGRDELFDPRFGKGHLTAQGLPYTMDGAHVSLYGSRAIARQLPKAEIDRLVNALFAQRSTRVPDVPDP
ncbi:MAG: acyltransferase family protein [Steroidobacteraceae bacterium]